MADKRVCMGCEFINLCTIEMCFYDKDEYEAEVELAIDGAI